jgi:hypothetical protein
MKSFIVTARSNDETWSFGPFPTIASANAFALESTKICPEIEYESIELIDPQLQQRYADYIKEVSVSIEDLIGK